MLSAASLALFGIPGARAEEAPLKVFVLAGQSNMVGRAVMPHTDAKLKEPQPQALLFTGSSWVPLAPEVTGAKGYGPEITFARDMTAFMGEPIGIVKFAVNGTDMARFWKPGGKLYLQLAALVKKAQESRPIEIVGMLWLQGEQDAKLDTMANSYGTNLANLIETTRREFGNKDMYFVAGRVNPEVPEKFPALATVRTAQESCKLPNYVWIDLDPLSKYPDKVHYDTAGIQQAGVLFAQAMQKMMKETGGKPAPLASPGK